MTHWWKNEMTIKINKYLPQSQIYILKMSDNTEVYIIYYSKLFEPKPRARNYKGQKSENFWTSMNLKINKTIRYLQQNLRSFKIFILSFSMNNIHGMNYEYLT